MGVIEMRLKMSSMQPLLDELGNKGYLRLPYGDILEGGGWYKGFEYCVIFRSIGVRCGYVAVHPKHYYANECRAKSELDVHGGITHCEESNIIESDYIWIGFDADHWEDSMDYEAIRIYGLKRLDVYKEGGSVKTYEYMKAQCEHLIDQVSLK